MSDGASGSSGLRQKMISQFHRPRGLFGRLAGFILANRKSNVQRNAWTVELLGIQPGDRVLELGFGPGVSIEAASRFARDGLVVGVDHSETMLRMASQRNAKAIREGHVRLIEASLDQLPAFEEPFDRVFAVNALQFADDQPEVLRAIRDRMGVGAHIAITQQARNPKATDQDSIRGAERVGEQLAKLAFDSLRIETLPLEPVCAACVLARAC